MSDEPQRNITHLNAEQQIQQPEVDDILLVIGNHTEVLRIHAEELPQLLVAVEERHLDILHGALALDDEARGAICTETNANTKMSDITRIENIFTRDNNMNNEFLPLPMRIERTSLARSAAIAPLLR